MKEFVIYDSVKHNRKWVDLVVTSPSSFNDARRRFKEQVREHRYLEASGSHGCIRTNGKVIAWYRYQADTRKWYEVRKPMGWAKWQPLIEPGGGNSKDADRGGHRCPAGT